MIKEKSDYAYSTVDECYQWVDVIRSFEVVAGKDFHFIGFSRLKPHVQVDSV